LVGCLFHFLRVASFGQQQTVNGNPLIFSQPDSRSRSGLLPAESPWGYSHSIRARRGSAGP